MTIDELSREQLAELRENTLHELFAALDMGTPSYNDIMNAAEYVTDALMLEYYGGTVFSNDDFFCSAE